PAAEGEGGPEGNGEGGREEQGRANGHSRSPSAKKRGSPGKTRPVAASVVGFPLRLTVRVQTGGAGVPEVPPEFRLQPGNPLLRQRGVPPLDGEFGIDVGDDLAAGPLLLGPPRQGPGLGLGRPIDSISRNWAAAWRRVMRPSSSAAMTGRLASMRWSAFQTSSSAAWSTALSQSSVSDSGPGCARPVLASR